MPSKSSNLRDCNFCIEFNPDPTVVNIYNKFVKFFERYIERKFSYKNDQL
jgi:hypothetical protein